MGTTSTNMEAFVARQPIFDRQQRVYAYELLFRDSMDNFMPEIDSDTATNQLLQNSFLTIGVDEICDGRHSFINFTDNLLKKKTPLLLPRESLVIEIIDQPMSEILATAYEKGQWRTVETLARKMGIRSGTIPKLYFDACRWSNSTATTN